MGTGRVGGGKRQQPKVYSEGVTAKTQGRGKYDQNITTFTYKAVKQLFKIKHGAVRGLLLLFD